MPDSVLGLVAAGVGLAAVTVAEAWIDAQRDFPAGGSSAELVDHVGRAAVDVDAVLDAQVERFAVEDVGRVDYRRRRALGRVARRQGTANLARTDRIHQRAVPAQQVQNGQVRACLLRISHRVEGGKVTQSPQHHGGIVDESGRAELPCQLGDGNPGNRGPRNGKQRRRMHHLNISLKSITRLLSIVLSALIG